MADKPKTYPQQIQELKQQVEDKEAFLASMSDNQLLAIELQKRVTELEAQLAVSQAAGTNSVRSDKAFVTDLEQRAVSAEQGIKNLNARINELIALNAQLEQQLDILGTERDKNLGKNDKIIFLQEQIQQQNFQILTLNQRLKDLAQEKDVLIESLGKELRQLRQLTTAQENKIQQFVDEIRGSKDHMANLKRIAGIPVTR